MAYCSLHSGPTRALAVVAAALILGAVGSPGAAQTLTPIVVTTTTAGEALPFFYAQAHGMFARAGLDVTTNLAASGSTVELAVVGGAANIGFTNTLTLTNAVAKGVPLVAIAPGTNYESAHPDVRTLTYADSPIHTGKDLDGKTIGVPGLHDAATIATMAWVDQQGGDSKTFQFVEIPGSAMFAALQSHRVDAVTIYDPFAADFASKGARTLGYPNDAIAPHFLVTAWIADSSWVQTHRAAAERFAQVMHDSAAYCTAHFAELIPLIGQYSKLSVATLEKMQPETYPPGAYASELQPIVDVAAKYGNIRDFLAAREIFDSPLNTASTGQ